MDKQRLKKLLEKPRKVALYVSLEHGYEMVSEVGYSKFNEHFEPLPDGEERERPHQGFVRISEPADLVLRGIDNDSITQNAVAALDEEERKAREELNAKIIKIREMKHQLLALTHQVTEEEA